MEVRTLARCLRARPTVSSSLLYSQQSTFLRGQSILGSNFLRYQSSDSASSQTPPKPQSQESSSTTPSTPEQNNPSPQNKSPSADFDQILNQLDLNGRNAAAQANAPSDQPQNRFSNRARQRGVFNDALSLSRAVGMSAETDNYRQPARKIDLKLGPRLGREINVAPEHGRDLPTALAQLGMALQANRVKAQFNDQKFHTRKGMVRKQLRMKRWRKLFKFSFQHTVKRIQRMRAQGW